MPLPTLPGVSLAFGHLPLVADADLRIEAGERLALIGRNGSGKSTLLKVVAGELEPDAGGGWGAPGLRISRRPPDIPDSPRPVRDEIAAGLPAGEEGWSVAHK